MGSTLYSAREVGSGSGSSMRKWKPHALQMHLLLNVVCQFYFRKECEWQRVGIFITQGAFSAIRGQKVNLFRGQQIRGRLQQIRGHFHHSRDTNNFRL